MSQQTVPPPQQDFLSLISPISPSNFDYPDTNSKWKERNDRQLRLWGINGQDRINNAKVLLLNGTSVGAEVLKNIVLPGFGEFTIIDNSKVTERDLGINFFVTKDSIGQSKAETLSKNIVELNSESVVANFMNESVQTVLEKAPDLFDNYNYIIASQMDTKTLLKVAKICWEKQKVLMVVRSYGFVGYLRVVVSPTHEVVESKLDNELDDLRISDAWSELLEFASSQQIEQMSDRDFKHTPYVIVLMRCLQQWRQQQNHSNAVPETKEEKEAFVKMIKQLSPTEGGEENIQEALSKVHYAWNKSGAVPDVIQQQIFDDPCIEDDYLKSDNAKNFWYLARAVKEFVNHEGQGNMPLLGKVPDMFADTDRYVKLQTIYRKKARDDAVIVKKHLIRICQQFGKDYNTISDLELKEFCKNSLYIRAYHYRSLEQELETQINKDEILNQLYDSTSNIIWYILLLCCDRFYEQHGYYPENMEQDVKLLTVLLKQMIENEYGITSDDYYFYDKLEDYAREMTRFGNSELHNISALLGGVAAQELIKLCTLQRLPLNNTWIFNGIDSTSTTVEL